VVVDTCTTYYAKTAWVGIYSLVENALIQVFSHLYKAGLSFR
jgi:hypothetical protein